MKNIITYTTYLLISILSPKVMAQDHCVKNISWKILGNIPSETGQSTSIGLAGAISGTSNDVFIVAGGTNFPDKMPWLGGQKRYYDQIFIFNKELKPLKTSFKLPFNLAYSAVISTQKGIVVAGGENEKGLSKKVILLNWNVNNNDLEISYLPDLPKATTNASITVIDDKIYLAGGEFVDASSDQFLILDLNNKSQGWQYLPKLPFAVSHSVLLGTPKEDKIFLIGGRRKNSNGISTIYNQVYAFDLGKQSWTERASLPNTLSAASGLTLENELLVFSGDEGATFSKAESLIAKVQTETNPLKKDSLNKLKIEVQSSHPGFSKSVLKYVIKDDKWLDVGNLLPYGPVTTNAVLFNNKIIIAGGEVKAGVRTPHILAGKIDYKK